MAVAAAGDGLDRDARARRRPADAIAERDDFSRGFMPDDQRARYRPPAATIDAVEQQEIGAAEAGRINADERVTWSRDRRGCVEHIDMAGTLRRLDDGIHQPRISMRASVQFRTMLR